MDGSVVPSRLPMLALLVRTTWHSAMKRLRVSARWASLSALFAFSVMLGGCGGGGSDPPPGGTVGGVTTPVVTTQPASQTVASGGSVTFSVAATGDGLAYQWQRSTTGGVSWQDIAGATSSSYTIAAADASMNGDQYHVVVQNTAGVAASAAATLNITGAAGAPVISQQPSDHTVAVSATATFAVTATGIPAPTFQWQVSTDGGASFSDITGATGASYATPATALADNGRRFRVVATNAVGSVTSTSALLSVTAATGISQRYVYVSGDWGISGYAVNPSTGASVPTPGSPYAGRQSGLVLHPSGNFLYAAEGRNNWGVRAYRIDPTDGRLSIVPGSPFATSMDLGSLPRIDSGGRYMALQNGVSLAVYRIDATTGVLASAGTLVVPTSRQVVFSADSQFIFAYEPSSSSSVRAVRTDPPAIAATSNVHVVSEPVVRGNYVVAALIDGRLASLAIDPSSGLLSLTDAVATALNADSTAVVPHPNGSCFLLSALTRFVDCPTTIRTVALNVASGALRLASGSLQVEGKHSLMASLSGDYGYLTGGPTWLQYSTIPLQVDGGSCSVALNSAGGFLPAPSPMAVTLDAGGSLAFGTSGSPGALNILRVDATTRHLSPVTGSPVPLPGFPNNFVVR